ncbi:MAG TPA: HEAT repeat domain-containing protein [Clostridiales bacterium]|nr:HEAT repeat domain-containing protein [Clostridiales bacterium]
MFGMFGISEEKIAKWGEKGKGAKLIKAAMSRKPNIRLAAVKAMGNVDDEQVFNLLITCLRDRSPEIKIAAMESLKKLNSKNAVEHVKSLVNDTNSQVADKAREVIKYLNLQ